MMNFVVFLCLSLVLNSPQSFAIDTQTISDEAQGEVHSIGLAIKENLREAIVQNEKRVTAKNKIINNPREYDLQKIQAEWDRVIAELRAGEFCRGCHRSKTEYGPGFEEHAAQNGGIDPASPQDYENANSKYGNKYNTAKNVNENYNFSRNERARLILNAKDLIYNFHRKIQVAYDFQLRVFLPIKQNAKEVDFKELSNLLVRQDRLVSLEPIHTDDYKKYKIERFATAVRIDSCLVDLNDVKLKILKEAEIKKEASLRLVKEIYELAQKTGEDEVPSASVTAELFQYTLLRDTYYSIRNPERLNFLLDTDIFELYNKVKNEGN